VNIKWIRIRKKTVIVYLKKCSRNTSGKTEKITKELSARTDFILPEFQAGFLPNTNIQLYHYNNLLVERNYNSL